MALSTRDRVLYARHLLLAEIGSKGQEQLCDTQVSVPAEGDVEASAVALDYLERAGMKVRSSTFDLSTPTLIAPVADESAVLALAGLPALRHAAAALLGAFAATEAIKQAIDRGVPANFPAQLSFLSEDA